MRFSANGYARLNEKLAPDLCSWRAAMRETALPYVNTGIIQAMAGLDYSTSGSRTSSPADSSSRQR